MIEHEYIYNTRTYEPVNSPLYANIYEGFLYEGDVLYVESDDKLDEDYYETLFF